MIGAVLSWTPSSTAAIVPSLPRPRDTFFERPAPPGYLSEWSRWLGASPDVGAPDAGTTNEENETRSHGERVSVLIFRLGDEWLAFHTEAVAEVATPRPVHRVPHRSNEIVVGLVNLQGQVQLCVSLHGLLGAAASASASASRLIVLYDSKRAEKWVFSADEVLGVHKVPRSQWRSVPSTLVNPAVGFAEAVLSWKGRSVGLLDEQRVFTALRSLGS